MKSCFVVLLIAALAISARAQIPYIGFCPGYLPMPGFDMERFLGVWYEAERSFNLGDIASRCVMSNYTRSADNKFYVINEVRSRLTGIKRVLEGEIRKAPSKTEEGKLHVKYMLVPVIAPETEYSVLETDYNNYAVLWSCSGVFPISTQNAWLMTRQRIASSEILQKAYGVLDKYRISKNFLLKTNQEDCAYDNSGEPSKATEPPKEQVEEYEDGQSVAKSVEDEEKPVVAQQPEAEKPAAVVAAAVAEPIIKADAVPKSVPELVMKIANRAKEQLAEEAKEQAEETPVAEPVKEAVKEMPSKEEPVAEMAKESAPVAAPEEKKIEASEKKAEIFEEKIEIVKP